MKSASFDNPMTPIRAMILALCVTLPLLSCAPRTSALTDLTGFWALRAPDGRTGFFELKQKGEIVEGVDIGFRKLQLSGTLRHGELHLTGSFVHRGQSHIVKYDGVVKDGRITMIERRPVTINGGSDLVITGSLERTTREEIFPPRLPLPALHDLPDNGLVRRPPMGWNSWYSFHTAIDDPTVRAMADAMVSSGMSKAGYKYILIDGGWEGLRDANGDITSNAKFPDMKALADYVHSKGLQIGIYSSPGPQTCGGYQGSYGHEEQDAMTFARWGFDYLKYDWCTASRVYQTADLQAVYQKMGQALVNTGRPIVYSLCEYGDGDVWKWGAKVGGNLWRTSDDITDSWSAMESNGFSEIGIGDYAKPGHWNDPDNLEVGNGGMTTDEYQTQMSLWALLRAPLIAGNDLRQMSQQTQSILMNRDVIAIDQDPSAEPMKRIMQQGTVEIYRRQLSGGSLAVGLFNRGEQPAEVSVPWNSLLPGPVSDEKMLRAQDLWMHKPVRLSGDSYTAKIPAHAVVLLKISTVH
jgi:alpha-galactosidase